jgi:hypothetical protein
MSIVRGAGAIAAACVALQGTGCVALYVNETDKAQGGLNAPQTVGFVANSLGVAGTAVASAVVLTELDAGDVKSSRLPAELGFLGGALFLYVGGWVLFEAGKPSAPARPPAPVPPPSASQVPAVPMF